MKPLSDGDLDILRDCEWDVYGCERDCHGYDDDDAEADGFGPSELEQRWERDSVVEFLCDAESGSDS